MTIDHWEYTFEIQLGWFPGAGWLRAPYYRDTWHAAWAEAQQYAEFGARNGHTVSVQVIRINRSTGKTIPTDRDSVPYA
jgi:hypothetical protein